MSGLEYSPEATLHRSAPEVIESEARALRTAVLDLADRDHAAARNLCEGLLKMIGYAPAASAKAAPYIKPRKRKPDETGRETLCRRLEEYIEFANETRRLTEVGFYEALLALIEGQGGASQE